MTIGTITSKAGPFTSGAGPFAFGFKVFDQNDIAVYKIAADATESVLVLTAQYNVSLNTDQNNDPGGAVVLVAALSAEEYVYVLRVVALTQETDIQNAGGFYPEVIEDAFDRVTMGLQQLAEEMSRALKSSVGSALTADSLLASLNSTVAAVNATYDNFDDRYLGAKNADPTHDNDGANLITGAMYFNTTNTIMRVYTGSAWQNTAAITAGVPVDRYVATTAASGMVGGGDLTADRTLSFDIDQRTAAAVATGDALAFDDASDSGNPKKCTVQDVLALSTGRILQTVFVETFAESSTTSVIPEDSSVPQVSEGTQLFSQAFTPLSAASIVEIEVTVLVASDGPLHRVYGIALFDSGAGDPNSAIKSCWSGNAADELIPMRIVHRVASWGLSARTMSLRYGGRAGYTTCVNKRTLESGMWGNKHSSFLKITEYI